MFGPTIFTSGFYVGQPFTGNAAQIDSVVKAQRAAGFDMVKLHGAIDAEAYQTLCEDDAALCPVSVHPIPAAAHPKGTRGPSADRGNLELQKAFNQYHNNIHVASGSSIGSVAPGLHNFKGAELQASGCLHAEGLCLRAIRDEARGSLAVEWPIALDGPGPPGMTIPPAPSSRTIA